MAVLATFVIYDQVGTSSGNAIVGCSGMSVDGTVNFRQGVAPIQALVSPNSHRVRQDVEDAVKTALQGSPYNMTFGSGDTVRMIG